MRSIQKVTKELSGRKCHFSGQFFGPAEGAETRSHYSCINQQEKCFYLDCKVEEDLPKNRILFGISKTPVLFHYDLL